jgi:hypothetical protein
VSPEASEDQTDKDQMTDTTGTTTALLFQAPPAAMAPAVDDDVDSTPDRGNRGGNAKRGNGPAAGGPGQLRMLKGARQAAAGMNISDSAIREVLEDPQDVQPDPNRPERTRLQRGGLVVTTGQDGTILRVARRR